MAGGAGNAGILPAPTTRERRPRVPGKQERTRHRGAVSAGALVNCDPGTDSDSQTLSAMIE